MLKKRIITVLWSFPLAIIAIWFDKPLPWFTILMVVLGILAVLEFYRITAVTSVKSHAFLGVIWAVLFILSPHFDYDFLMPLLLASALVLFTGLLLLRPQREGAFANWAWTMAGLLYVGWLLSYLVALRLDAGRNWVFFVLLVTIASDTAAFFVGRAVGKYRLAPYISPHKTWEGAIAGVGGAIIVSFLFTLPTPFALPLSYGQAILLGFLVSVFGQLGDLLESLMKRKTGVKESGKLMPGHGGILDRMDSVIFAGMVVYYFFLITQ